LVSAMSTATKPSNLETLDQARPSVTTPRTCFLPNDLDGPGFYRLLFPMRELRKHGWDAVVPPQKFQGARGENYWTYRKGEQAAPKKEDFFSYEVEFNLEGVEADLWVVQRHHCTNLLGSRKVVIGEQDDNSMHVPKWHRSYRKKHVQNEAMHEGFRHCDALTVSTPQIAEDYAHINDNIYVLRNYLDWEMWEDVEQQSEVERGRIRVGWMGAYDFRIGDLHVLRGVVGPWLGSHPNVDFVVAGPGAERTHDLLGIPDGQRVVVEGVDFSSGNLPDITAVMDIGLVPLEPGRFNEGKSHLKGMEYAACGIPCIATPTESYRYWIEEGVNGLFASKPAHWRRALETFVGDDAYRRECGRNARLKARANTIQEHWREWADVYMVVWGGRKQADDLQGVGATC
jgi:glycosyltransferase involved in cell wall biosynthesis